MNPMLLTVFYVLLIGACTHEERLASRFLNGNQTSTFTVVVHGPGGLTKSLCFKPTSLAGMSAYKQPVFNARIRVWVENSGGTVVDASFLKMKTSLQPGQRAEVFRGRFSDFRITLDSESNPIHLRMEFEFDQAHYLSSWKLVSMWADGP